MIQGYYINKSDKLNKSLNKYLAGIQSNLSERYGEEKAWVIIKKAKQHYPQIIPLIPFFNTPMYDALIVLNSRMMALKKGMKNEGIGVEDFVGLQIENLRSKTKNLPQFLKKMMGRLYLSMPVRFLLKKVGKSATKNGWPTELIDGKPGDNFSMKIVTKNCQMLNFMCSVGEEDIQPYCTFADLTTAETLGLGLKQTSSIDSGACSYCFSKKGNAEWPKAVQSILDKSLG